MIAFTSEHSPFRERAAKKLLDAAKLSIIIGATTLTAQEQRCDWHGELVTDYNKYYKCIDIGAVNGSTIKVPSTVTRISLDGLSLCMNQVVKPGEADIVYLMDNTSSMNAGCASFRNGDTLYHENGCGSSQVGTITAIYKDGTRQLNVVSGGNALAGDPFGQRAIVTKQAIKLHQQYCSIATAGFITFNGPKQWNLESYSARRQRPLEISRSNAAAQQNVETLYSKIWIDAPGELPLAKQTVSEKIFETGWADPLELAKKWLSADSGLTKTKNQAIVLVSDGRPNDWLGVEPMIEGDIFSPGKMPPVYGIQLGSSSEGDMLKVLAERTGGAYFAVPPTDTDSLKRVMAKVVGSIVKTSIPKTITVTNKAFSPPQVSNAQTSAMAQNPDGGWPLLLDQVVGILEGPNMIEVSGVFLDTKTGRDTTINFSFTIDASAPPTSSTNATTTCYELSKLTILSRSGQPVEYLTWRDSALTLELTTSGPKMPFELVNIKSITGGDAETVRLDFVSISADSQYVTYRAHLTFKAGSAAVSANNLIETAKIDSLSASWVHSRDPRDRAVAKISIEDPAVESPVASPPGDTFSCPLSVALSTPTPGARIWYTLDGTAPGQNKGTSKLFNEGDKIVIDNTTILKAVAELTGFASSRVVIENYTRLAVEKLTAAPAAGDYYGSMRLRLLTATPGAAIWYTLDGSEPAPNGKSSFLYADSGIVIRNPGTTVVKAFAIKGCYVPGDILTAAYVNKDSEGPFVTSAVFYPGSIPGRSDKRPDTLVVTLSEQVVWQDDNAAAAQILNYFRSAVGKIDNAFDVVLSFSKDEESCVIVIPPDGFRIRPLSDSVQLAGDREVAAAADRYGNVAPPNGKKAQITWGVKYEWVPVAGPNPFTPRKTLLPTTYIQKVAHFSRRAGLSNPISSSGIAVMVQVLGDSEGEVTICDALGNIIISKEPMVADPETHALHFIWDGRNGSGRYVGSGSYMATIQVKDLQGMVVAKRLMLGVRR